MYARMRIHALTYDACARKYIPTGAQTYSYNYMEYYFNMLCYKIIFYIIIYTLCLSAGNTKWVHPRAFNKVYLSMSVHLTVRFSRDSQQWSILL